MSGGTNEKIGVRIWRGDQRTGAWADYEVPRQPSQTVLDVVTWIQRHAEPALAYRFACRVGMCGSCAMTVNGEPRWTCRTHVQNVLDNNRLDIGPLRNLPVIKDLVTDMTEFFEKWVAAKGVFEPSASRTDPLARISPQSGPRQQANDGIECINCAVCYAACDTVAQHPGYLGPAALNRAWTLVNDERDAGNTVRLAAVTGPEGCTNCHSHQSCERYCPNELNPTGAIAGLKRTAMAGLFRRGAHR